MILVQKAEVFVIVKYNSHAVDFRFERGDFLGGVFPSPTMPKMQSMFLRNMLEKLELLLPREMRTYEKYFFQLASSRT